MNKTLKFRDRLSAIRAEAVEHIKEILRKHQISELGMQELCPGFSPILREDPYDANKTLILDSVALDEKGTLWFIAGSACEDLTVAADKVPVEVLMGVVDWIEMNEESIMKPQS